jgi:hypothetical protein
MKVIHVEEGQRFRSYCGAVGGEQVVCRGYKLSLGSYKDFVSKINM